MTKRLRHKLKIISTLLLASFLLLILCPNYLINRDTQNKTFNNISTVSKNQVGLVLGTAKYLKDGRVNLYFSHRIEATVELFLAKKIDFVLISGDNSKKDYDEPTDFKNELIKRGIPEHLIFLDFAGFRTLDSMVRAKRIFGLKKLTVISQKFHNERAIYLAEKHRIEAIGFNAKNVEGVFGLKVKLREYLARTKVFIDLALNVEPKYYGKKVEIGLRE